jgi:hypothetical protein
MTRHNVIVESDLQGIIQSPFLDRFRQRNNSRVVTDGTL